MEDMGTGEWGIMIYLVAMEELGLDQTHMGALCGLELELSVYYHCNSTVQY